MRRLDTDHFLAVGIAGTAAPRFFADEATLGGSFALSGMTEKVTAELLVRESGTLTREMLIAFTDKETGQRVRHFDDELTQELHVLATDSEFSSFVHGYASKLGLDGRFKVEMRFPKAGTYHVYADAVPTSRGQQVIRFEVPVDVTTGSTAPQQAAIGVAEESTGPYMVKLDPSALRAGTESRWP
jgi:hypothetical protein